MYILTEKCKHSFKHKIVYKGKTGETWHPFFFFCINYQFFKNRGRFLFLELVILTSAFKVFEGAIVSGILIPVDSFITSAA